jgi:hypothetical protein
VGRRRWMNWLILAAIAFHTGCAGKKRPFEDEPYVADTSGGGAAGNQNGGTAAKPVSGVAGPETGESGVDINGGLTAPVGAVLGAACSRDLECASSFCADGVCCDARCGELCATCAAPGQAGTCSAASSDPGCGVLACAGGTECRGYDQAQLEQNCAAFGQCKAGIDCQSLDQPEGTTCQAGTGTCDGLGECVVPGKALLGGTCATDADCGEGHCVARSDGTSACCDSACDGLCQQCSAAGRCVEAPATDARCAVVDCPDDNVCHDYPDALTDNLCRGFGQCRTAVDCPSSALRVESACECGADGACSLARGQRCTSDAECGLAVCAASVTGETVCCAAACGAGLSCSSDGTRCVECEGNTIQCDGNTELRCGGDTLTRTACEHGCTPGIGCNAQAPVGFLCDTVECQPNVVCQADVLGERRCCSRDCAAEGKICSENGSCVCAEGTTQAQDSSCLLQQGDPCGPTSAACEAGLTCVDGVCCAETCGGGCESCNVAGTIGQCVFAADDTTSCAAGEQCVARGQCRLRGGEACSGDDTRCVSNNCEAQLGAGGGTVCCAASCAGALPFCSRDSSRCVQCETNADCPNGCQNGTCLPLRPLGELCDVASQCSTGVCTLINGTNTSRCCGQCTGGQVCNATGGCECPPGQTAVNGQCRKVQGQTCAPQQGGSDCTTGNCELAADGANRCCADACGDANARCAQDGSGCDGCETGFKTCNGACIPANQCCGGCAAGQTCVNAQCLPDPGQVCTAACSSGICSPAEGGGSRCCVRPCATGELCDQLGQCVVQRVLGGPEAPCSVDSDCATGPCIDTFLDNDGDGFALEAAAAPANVQKFCTQAPDGRTATRPVNQDTIDCLDSNGDVSPGQKKDFVVPIPNVTPPSFDYNCDLTEDSADPVLNDFQNCADTTIPECSGRGSWANETGPPTLADVPECGASGYISPCIDQFSNGSCGGFAGGPRVRPCH